MILVDLNQVLISNLMAQTRGDIKADKDLIRHMVVTSLKGYNTKFAGEYGKQVLCSDASNPWRRTYFPNYKYSRRKGRDDDQRDWTEIFNVITEIKNEIRDNFPYVMLYIEQAEADDIIATLVKEYHQSEKIMIISGDKDFIQLQKYQNVKQYAPIQKKMIGDDNPNRFLQEQIMRGDRSDGIPNVLSDNDVFVTGTKQKPITKKRLELLLNGQELDDNIKSNIERNTKLIDLDRVPALIYNTIISNYRNYKVNDRSLLLNYFITNKLSTLIENINDF